LFPVHDLFSLTLFGILVLLLGWLFSTQPQRKFRSRARPEVEWLEIRAVPEVVFIWKAPVQGAWTNPNNWIGPAGQYPDDPNDEAFFDGGRSQENVTIDGENITVGRIGMGFGYTGEIQLHDDLVIKPGTGITASLIQSNGKIVPMNVGADVVLDGGHVHS
jgi:hypothetical protein